jgi:PTS system cellobiose-specific IIC component
MYAENLGMQEALATVPLTVATFFIITPTELYKSIPTEWLVQKGILRQF